MKKQAKNNSMILRLDDLLQYEPMTITQEKAFKAWDDGDHLVLTGSAGTGKTFIAVYMAMEAILNREESQEKIVIVRSVVPTREVGFLPGSKEEKEDVYTAPYRSISDELFGQKGAYGKLVNSKQVEFISTSYIRGTTIDDACVIIDEMQNMNFHELDSIITRIGRNCRVIFAGDYLQSDFKYDDDKNGIYTFMQVVERLKDFSIINFGWEDIVRSDFVRDYIMTKEMLGISKDG